MMIDFDKLKNELINKLRANEQNVTDYLETDKNVYRIETDVETNKNVFLNPAISCLENRDFVGFDVYQDKKDAVSLISDENKLSNLITLSERFKSSQTTEVNIFENNEKIKYFYVKVDNICFVYHYTSGAYLKAKTFLKLGIGSHEIGRDSKELQLVTEEDDRITLDKQYPDLIFDIEEKCAYLINSKQSEFIIDLEVEINKTKSSFPKIQQDNKIFSEGSYAKFEDSLNDLNKSKSRKFVKMIENETYKKFVEHRDKAIDIKNRYELGIIFNDYNEIVFDDDTSIEDILHLLADDYVQSYLDEESKVIDQ